MKANQSGIIREIGDDRLEIESPVGNMESDQSAVSQFLQVEVHRFPSEEMNGNRIRAKGVEDQQPILPFGSFSQSQSGVSQDHIQFSGGVVLQKGEIPRV